MTCAHYIIIYSFDSAFSEGLSPPLAALRIILVNIIINDRILRYPMFINLLYPTSVD